MNQRSHSGTMPIIALRGLAVFPNQTVHFDVGRLKSVKALEEAMKQGQFLFLVPQKDMITDDPTLDDLCPVGTVARIKQILHPQGESLRILVNGICRGRIAELIRTEPYLYGEIQAIDEVTVPNSPKNSALCREAVALYGDYLDHSEFPGQAVYLKMMSSNDPGELADCIGQNSGFPYQQKNKLLRNMNPVNRLISAMKMLNSEMEILQLETLIQDKTQASMNQNQKEYYLREQMKAIREELGEGDEQAEYDAYEARIRALQLDETSEKKVLKDLERLKKQPFGSAEASVLRNYLDTVLELPWGKKTKERVNVAAAKKILAQDHYGLEKVKERILETIAVRQMTPEMPPQIICLVGPPGVGKTSIAYSIARALNRNLARIS